MRRLTQIPGMTLAVMLTLVVAQGLVFGPAAHAEDARGLEGTWLMEATLVDCDTGQPLPIPGNPFPALHTYLRGGTMQDAGAPPPRPTAVTRSAAHGIWERTGDQTFRVRFRFFGFDAAGVHAGTFEVTIERSLQQGDHSKMDEIIGAGTVRIFNPAGVLVGAGCNRDRGRRLEFEEKE